MRRMMLSMSQKLGDAPDDISAGGKYEKGTNRTVPAGCSRSRIFRFRSPFSSRRRPRVTGGKGPGFKDAKSPTCVGDFLATSDGSR
jgi:hypothetical protein